MLAEDYSLSQQAQQSETEEASGGGLSNEVPEETPGSSQKQDMDEDDLPAEQAFRKQEPGHEPPPAVLTEIDEDGNETIISDHSTSAGFTFQNSLIYELD